MNRHLSLIALLALTTPWLLAAPPESARVVDDAVKPQKAADGTEQFPLKPVEPPGTALDESIQRGIAFLLKDQNKDGSWGGPTRTKGLNIYAPVPGAHHAFTDAVTALCVSALIEAGGDSAPVRQAVERGEAFLMENLPKLRRATPDALYNIWGHGYGVQALVRMHERLPQDEARRTKLKEMIREQMELLARYESVDGGWGYYDFRVGSKRPATDSTSFQTAAILEAFHEAQQIGVEPPAKLVKSSVDSIVRQRKPDFSYLYGEYLRWRPMMGINRPGGSLGRSQACNLALRLFGDPAVTDDVLRTWLSRLFARNLWLDIGRKRPIPHESHFQVAGYFYYFGHYYAALCINQLKPSERAFYQDHLARTLMPLQEQDGSWWDYPLYNYHQQYGTAFTLMALHHCRHDERGVARPEQREGRGSDTTHALRVTQGVPPATFPRPNVVVIMSDDQGYGDLGCHGNPKIRTPNLDRFAREGSELRYFYVSPVCAPTRSSLLTGRYNYRTGAVDTALGRALMYPEEVTLAQMLGKAGYRTGIFGKWHLGDNYPMRPQDRGFQETLVLKGGGIGQPSDPPGGSSYFDPVLQHNGTQVKTHGYCSDVYVDAACRFIESNREKPFFAYVPFNAPHTPLQVPEEDYRTYKNMNLALSEFPKAGFPVQGKYDADQTAKIYGMVTHLDRAVGRLLAKLDDLKLADNTIVIFLTDNGPQQPRFTAGLHGRKGTVYDGGIRVPFFVRWPKVVPAGRKLDAVAAHIDITPTLLDACRVEKPARVKMDGTSLLPLLKGERAELPKRTLFFQWHRGNKPELYRACAARTPRWKLVQPVGMGATPFDEKPRFELYDMQADPYEQHDVAPTHPEIVARLKQEYEAWFRDVSAHGYPPSRIHLGTPHENPTVLTRQDWRGDQSWMGKGVGGWEVQITRAGTYFVTVTLPEPATGKAQLSAGDIKLDQAVTDARECRFGPLRLPAGAMRLEAWVDTNKEKIGPQFLEVRRAE